MTHLSRRSILAGAAAMATVRRAAAEDVRYEIQYGDPDLPPETVPIYEESVASLSTSQTRADFFDRDAAFAQALVDSAAGFLGLNRSAIGALLRGGPRLHEDSVPARAAEGPRQPAAAAAGNRAVSFLPDSVRREHVSCGARHKTLARADQDAEARMGGDLQLGRG